MGEAADLERLILPSVTKLDACKAPPIGIWFVQAVNYHFFSAQTESSIFRSYPFQETLSMQIMAAPHSPACSPIHAQALG
jgi:hypothetical protein